MEFLKIQAGPYAFTAKLELASAPLTCARFIDLLPFHNKVIHARRSGEGGWVPLGDFDTRLDFENHTGHPSRGDILLYPGGTAKRKSCSPTAVAASRARWAISRGTIF